MMVIAPGHSDEYGGDTCPLDHPELFSDPWYKDDTHESIHQVWRCWRDGRLHDGTRLPDMLALTLVHCPQVSGFREEIEQFMRERNVDESSKLEVSTYLEWIDHWREKGAEFYLSM